MIDIIEYGDFKPLGKQKKKKQIILMHSSRNSENYLTSLKYRHYGNYNKIPNYFIDRDGKILKLLDNTEHSGIFNDQLINKNSIIICLENLGWLQKEPLKKSYINWIGDIYNQEPYERKWRDYFIWQPYTETQEKKTSELCKKLINEMSINNEFVGHNTKINKIERFEGIVTRSNFDSDFTDLSPAFNFENFVPQP